MFVYALQNPETGTCIALPYYNIIDVLDEDLLNDISNIFKCCT